VSSFPGPRLEDYLAWNYNLIVDGDGSANMSLTIAEAMGVVPYRQQITTEQMQVVAKVFEEYRETVEYWLSNFDEENQGWRQYSSGYDTIPDELLAIGKDILESFRISKVSDV
jgi:hypothetical protein